MRKIITYLLFFISYSPLLLYIWIINISLPEDEKSLIKILNEILLDKNNIFLLLVLLTFFLFFLILLSIKKTAPYTKNIENIEEKNVAFLEYVMTYFFAFIGLKMTSPQEILGSCLLFGFIAYVYSKSSLIYSNPVLAIFGYNIYEATLKDTQKTIMIISKDSKITGNNIALIHLSNHIYFKN